MAKFRIYVSDTVTYERSQVVEMEAEDEIEACEKVLEICDDLTETWDIIQIDNTPYEAMLADPVIAP